MSGGAGTFWNAESLASAAGGRLVRRATRAITPGVSIDSRAVGPGQTFVALRGERVDGHIFVGDAAARGAALAIVDDERALHDDGSIGVVHVPDARAALSRLADSYRRAIEGVVFVGVTGSNGKTTTTRLIHGVLSGAMAGRCSVKSFNNDIGVPLTVLSAREGDRFVVCEVGTNHPGEIEPLSRLIRPRVGVITSIGRAHVEGLGGVEGVAREKASIVAGLEPGGVLLYSADAPVLRALVGSGPGRVSFGVASDAMIRVARVVGGLEGVRFTLGDGAEFACPLLGEHNACNCAAAVGVARLLGVDDRATRVALAGFRAAEMRLETVEIGGVRVLNDAYNANPDSMAAAVRTLREVGATASRRVAVLGDMLELGESGPAAHRELGELLAGAR